MSDAYVLESESGTITITAGALGNVVVGAAELVGGVRVRRPKRALEIAVEGDHARVSLELAVERGQPIHDLARDVQHAVARALTDVCGLEADAVDIAIEELYE
jgi:uncharacterized alkaline shock family protein YloU